MWPIYQSLIRCDLYHSQVHFPRGIMRQLVWRSLWCKGQNLKSNNSLTIDTFVRDHWLHCHRKVVLGWRHYLQDKGSWPIWHHSFCSSEIHDIEIFHPSNSPPEDQYSWIANDWFPRAIVLCKGNDCCFSRRCCVLVKWRTMTCFRFDIHSDWKALDGRSIYRSTVYLEWSIRC